jgi:tRNA/rRNA methyltransferase
MNALSHIRIVLVEPAGALNVGSIARALKNMGLRDLVVVNPRCDILGEEARRMAVKGFDLLETARIVADLPTALTGCTRAVATTAREDLPTPPQSPESVLPYLFTTNATPTALIFGREDRGLSNEELNYAQHYLRIPAADVYTSLNLAQAVAICAYELNRLAHNPSQWVASARDLASIDSVEGYHQQLETLLLEIGYLQPHTATARMQKLRQLYNRSALSANEVAMLRGILSQVKWAIDRVNPNS